MPDATVPDITVPDATVPELTAESLVEHPLLAPYLRPEHRQLQAEAHAFFADFEKRHRDLAAPGHIGKEEWRDIGASGLLGASLSEEQGGRGLGLLGAMILNEAMAALDDLGLTLGMHCQNEIALAWLTTAQEPVLHERYLGEMLAGRLIGCACDTEPDGVLESRAVIDGDELVIDARKLYVVNGFNADLCFVTVDLDGQMATVLVEKDRPGVRVEKVFDKLGTRLIDSAALVFDAVRVPLENLAIKRGVRQQMQWNKIMTTARFLMCVDAYLVHRRLLERVLAYGRARRVGDRRLVDYQLNQHALARAVVDQGLMLAGIVDRFERLEKNRNAVAEVAALKWFCVERTAAFAALCAEWQGGAGYMLDSDFLNLYRQIRGLKMAGGSSTTMLAIADQALAYREQLDDL